MSFHSKSPWISITVLITAMVAGYTLYLHQNGVLAASDGSSCPFKQACKGACEDQADCENGDCTHCPRCNGQAKS